MGQFTEEMRRLATELLRTRENTLRSVNERRSAARKFLEDTRNENKTRAGDIRNRLSGVRMSLKNGDRARIKNFDKQTKGGLVRFLSGLRSEVGDLMTAFAGFRREMADDFKKGARQFHDAMAGNGGQPARGRMEPHRWEEAKAPTFEENDAAASARKKRRK